MSTDHHPTQDELLSYVVGNCDTWLAALLACHLTLCPNCRREVQLLEDLGGALFDLWADELGATVAAPSRPPPPRPPAPPSPAINHLPDEITHAVPRPLHSFIRDPRARFRFLLPGLGHIPLNLSAGGRPVRLFRFEPGFTIEEHGHLGLEWAIVLSGALEEATTGEIFSKGHISRRHPSDVHSLVTSGDEPCVAAIATLGALRPHTLRGKMAAIVIGN